MEHPIRQIPTHEDEQEISPVVALDLDITGWNVEELLQVVLHLGGLHHRPGATHHSN
jgi:hypothetical protein